jgi:hypothetical protein
LPPRVAVPKPSNGYLTGTGRYSKAVERAVGERDAEIRAKPSLSYVCASAANYLRGYKKAKRIFISFPGDGWRATRYIRKVQITKDLYCLFWDVEPTELELDRDADYILGRVLERGRLRDIRWVLQAYGAERVHRFFRESGHPELSPRTLAFWRAYFRAENEIWKRPPSWRSNSSAPWID